LKVSFGNIEIREICEDNEKAVLKLGSEASNQLQNRLADMFSAESPLDLLAGKPAPLDKKSLTYKVDLHDGIVILFSPSNLIIPKLQDESVDWSKITRIKIQEIKQQK